MTPTNWTPVAEGLPDDDTLVLIAVNDDDVWTGYRDGDLWRYVDGMPIAVERVTHWMRMPAHPARADGTISRASAPTAAPERGKS
jgi:hypothetical protein